MKKENLISKNAMKMEIQYPYLLDPVKVVLRGRLLVLQKIPEISQISNLMVHLRALENKNKPNPQKTKSGEIIKIMAEISEIETKTYKESMRQTTNSMKKLRN